MAAAEIGRGELEALVAEYRHLRSEHAHARPDGRVRRHLGRRVARVQARFERLLGEAVADAELRQTWLDHLWGDAPAPAAPADPPAPLEFRGRSGTGSQVEVRRRDDGDYDVEVDGAAVERVAAADDLARTARGTAFRLGDLTFAEVFTASPAALAALALFLNEPRRGPPREHAPELIADGLVDRDFGLTARGRRALWHAAAGEQGRR